MYLHIQKLINKIEADEPDTAAAVLQEGSVVWRRLWDGAAQPLPQS